jgi:hypothetical protein
MMGKEGKEKKRKNKCLGADLKGPYLGDRDATKRNFTTSW